MSPIERFAAFYTFPGSYPLLGVALGVAADNDQRAVAKAAIIPQESFLAALWTGRFKRQATLAALLPALLDRALAAGTPQGSNRVDLATPWTRVRIAVHEFAAVPAGLLVARQKSAPPCQNPSYPSSIPECPPSDCRY